MSGQGGNKQLRIGGPPVGAYVVHWNAPVWCSGAVACFRQRMFKEFLRRRALLVRQGQFRAIVRGLSRICVFPFEKPNRVSSRYGIQWE